jgi:beta-lactam-binding protein with PASTA domain
MGLVVPDLRGLTEDEARAKARSAGLNVNPVSGQDWPSGPQRVVLQDPAPESSARSGSWVTVILDPPGLDLDDERLLSR